MANYALTQNVFSAAITVSPGQSLSVQNLGASDAKVDVYGSHDGSNYSKVGSVALNPVSGLDPVARVDMEGCGYAKLLLVSATGVTVDAYPFSSGAAVPAIAAPGSLGRLNRPPSVDDNSSKGYGASDVWNYNGVLYKPIAAPTTSQAVWDLVPSAPGGDHWYDIVAAMSGGAVDACFGLYAVKAGFTGSCVDVVATIAGVDTTITVTILADGEFDVNKMAGIQARADAGTKIRVSQWYDQSGGGKHATMATDANRPFIEWDEVLNQYVINFETATSSPVVKRHLDLPATVTLLTTRTISVWAAGRGICSAGKTSPAIGAVGVFGGNLFYFGNQYDSSPERTLPTMATWQTTDNYKWPSTYVPLEMGPCVVGAVTSASSTVFWCNENTGTNSSAPTSLTLSNGGAIGWTTVGAASYGAMRMTAWMLTKTTTLTTAVQQQIRYAAYRRHNIKPQAKDLVVFIGDSRTQGFNTAEKENMAMATYSRLKYPCRLINMGNSGWSSATFTLNSPSTLGGIATLYNSTRKNIAVYWTGVNDFIVDNLTAAQSYTAIKANVATLKAAGFYVILLMEADTTSATNSANTRMDTLRGLMTDGTHGADELLDLSVYPAWTDAATAAYWPDGLHPSAALSQMAASKIAERVDLQLALGQSL